MQIRAIATDLDGTLLRSDNTVSQRTREAVHAAEDAGLLVVLATGRPPRWIPPVVEELGERGLVVCANGASVYDPARHELVARTELDPNTVLGLVDELEERFPEALLAVEQGFDFGVDEKVEESGIVLAENWKLDHVRVGPIRSFLEQPVIKLIVRFPEEVPGTAAAVQAVVGDRAIVTHSTSEAFLEISHPMAHKANTVERLLEGSGIEANHVAAFGDMPNDIELIRWAGLGVAVENAAPPVKAVADEITATNDDDGVARVIERILTDH